MGAIVDTYISFVSLFTTNKAKHSKLKVQKRHKKLPAATKLVTCQWRQLMCSWSLFQLHVHLGYWDPAACRVVEHDGVMYGWQCVAAACMHANCIWVVIDGSNLNLAYSWSRVCTVTNCSCPGRTSRRYQVGLLCERLYQQGGASTLQRLTSFSPWRAIWWLLITGTRPQSRTVSASTQHSSPMVYVCNGARGW